MRHDLGAGLDRRRLILGVGALAPALAAPAVLRAEDAGAVVVATANGRLRGRRANGVSVFKGVPYGGSVSGANRFKAPPPPPSWTGMRDALRLGFPSIQPPRQSADPTEPAPGEDCLVLNVWTPAADGRRRPVMVYSHGGGFTTGAGWSAWQDGANLAREQDVVVVQSNHRLGLLGYLYLGGLLGPDYVANAGLQDIVAALRWVQRNIEAFGGDPHNVTIFGESGGGAKTACLYAMPSAAPYFHKASIESVPPLPENPPERATEQARAILARLGLGPHDARRLLDVPAAQLLAAQMAASAADTSTLRRGLGVQPVMDGVVLPETPFADHAPKISTRKPMIIGGCKDETVFFNRLDRSLFTLDADGLKQRLAPQLGVDVDAWITTFHTSRPDASPSELYTAITTAVGWRAEATHIAERKAAQNAAPVFSYILDYRSTSTIPGTDYRIGSPHASDIQMKFDTVRPDPASPAQAPGLFGADQTEARRQTARNMSTMWATFARTGRPGATGQPAWPAYTLADRATMIIDSDCRIEKDPEGAERRFWSRRPLPAAS